MAPRPSLVRLATGIVAEPSTTFTVTGMRMIMSRLPPAAGSSAGRLGAAPARRARLGRALGYFRGIFLK